MPPLKKASQEEGLEKKIALSFKKERGFESFKGHKYGGVCPVEYAQHTSFKELNYSLKEFANDVIFLMKEIAKNKKIEEPNIFTESGRFIASSHAVLIAPCIGAILQ